MKIVNRTDRMGFALAPKQLVKNRLKVRFMYREKPDNEYDSGWRFFTGFESEKFVNDPDNIGLYDVTTIIQIDNDVLPYLNSPEGSAFERATAKDPFIMSKNFF